MATEQKEKAVAIRESLGLELLAPAEIVAQATEQANALMDIVEKKHLYQDIEGKRYLEAEAWETIGAFNQTHALTDWVKPVWEVDQIVAYEAKVDLWKKGEKIGSAIMSCGLDEFPCRGKEGQAKHKAAKSAAQTWAVSKAYRMNFSYIAVLAGYCPTPLEEIQQSDIDKEHWCVEHNTAFFKKGKMKAYAHPIEGTDNWCHQHKGKPASHPDEKPKETPIPVVQPEEEILSTPDLKLLQFRNEGEFYTACFKYFKLSKSQVDKETPEYDKSKPSQRQDAWISILAVYCTQRGLAHQPSPGPE